MDPNPYEPPGGNGPLTLQAGKRKFELGAMLLLTPPAMVIAVIGSCTAADAVRGGWQLWIMLGLPLAALCAAMVTILAISNWAAQQPVRQTALAGILLATPIVVGMSCAVGMACAGAVYLVVSATLAKSLGPDDAARAATIPATIVFWCLPGGALLFMLRKAWIAGRVESGVH